jgi:hypothetical protein
MAIVISVAIGAAAVIAYKMICEYFEHRNYEISMYQNQIWYLLQIVMGIQGYDLEVEEGNTNETEI